MQNPIFNKTTFLISLGTTLEWAEYVYYAYMVSEISQLFFPASNAFLSTIAAFGVFTAGYLMRPLGALFFGYIGDYLGRKRALITSITLMGFCTLMMGLLPTYEDIGLPASFLLLFCRCLQGFAVSGESNGAAVYLIEMNNKYPHLTGSWVETFSALGMAMGGLAATLVAHSTSPYAWRIPFFIGALSCFLSYYLRVALTESENFKEFSKHHLSRDEYKLWPSLKRYRQSFFKVFFLTLYLGVLLYTCNLYYVTFLIQHQGFSSEAAKSIITLEETIFFLFIPLFGYLADKWNRNTLLKIGMIGSGITAFYIFWISDSSSIISIGAGQVVFGIFNAINSGVIYKFIFDLFPVQFRYRGISLGWSCGMLLGGVSPMLAEYLINRTENVLLPAVFAAGLGMIAYWVLFGREKAPNGVIVQAPSP